MPRGRKKKDPNAVDTTPKQSPAAARQIEQLYSQFATLMKKNKISKRDIASRVGMSYQGFLNSYNKQNLKLDTWMIISEYLNMPFVARFENGRKADSADLESNSASTSHLMSMPVSDDFTQMKLRNAEDKVAILERQVDSYERIISLLSEKMK